MYTTGPHKAAHSSWEGQGGTEAQCRPSVDHSGSLDGGIVAEYSVPVAFDRW